MIASIAREVMTKPLSDMPAPVRHRGRDLLAQVEQAIRSAYLSGCCQHALGTSIPMILHCPVCYKQHIDKPNPARGWTNPPHRSHECQNCGMIWRPADVPTQGVEKIETRGKEDTWPRRDAPIEPSSEPRWATCPARFSEEG